MKRFENEILRWINERRAEIWAAQESPRPKADGVAFDRILAWIFESRSEIWKEAGRTSFFWSGQSVGKFPVLNDDTGEVISRFNEDRASDWALVYDGAPIGKTEASPLIRLKIDGARGELTRLEERLLVFAASWRFAHEASGHVRAYTLDDAKRHPTWSSFLMAELPELLNNEKVLTINGHPREKLQTLAIDVLQTTQDEMETLKFVNEEINNRRELELNSARKRAFRELLDGSKKVPLSKRESHPLSKPK